LKLRVFLVEDLLNMHMLMREVCETLGGAELVACVLTEGEAKFWLAEHPSAWDVAVVDLMLEAGSGMAVIARCRELNRGGKICVFSSYITPVLKEHCERLGADAVFDKGQSLDFMVWLRGQVDALQAARPLAG
jgi:two-component system, OmpR family, response regulator